ncbi:hypothetical protein [Prosthecobacter sp.]|uniref:hypothetical protein n=1 Tax=Prosthecobacter sp. TaxID=1965333 RepID=UPI0037841126
MPDVGLCSATETAAKDVPVILRYEVEVSGELEKDGEKALALWARRLKCAVEARKGPGFSAACTPIDSMGLPESGGEREAS